MPEFATQRRKADTSVSEASKIWLSSGFRVELIKKGLDKAGSLNGLGRLMGYRSKVHPGWSVIQILLGRQPFPVDRLKRLSDFVGHPYDDIIRHQIPQNKITPQSTRDALIKYNLWCYLPK